MTTVADTGGPIGKVLGGGGARTGEGEAVLVGEGTVLGALGARASLSVAGS